MTYNVKGLPWPAASGRGNALAEIGGRLAQMRASGNAPDVVLLQEAFSDDAKAIGAAAGYRHVMLGPQSAPAGGLPPLGQAYAASARRDRGEGLGTVLDSGLVILSDYPIVRTDRIAFPQGACAGFDCLAAKGVMIAWIALPGFDRPVAFANTHLNSRRSTHVALERADAAHGWQIQELQRLIAGSVSPATPIVFGGDFNVGRVGTRMAGFAASPPLGESQKDAMAMLLPNAEVDTGSRAEEASIVRRYKDMILFRDDDSAGKRIVPQHAFVPFPYATAGSPLSDHAGFVVRFASSNASRPGYRSQPEIVPSLAGDNFAAQDAR
ncbi:endonuclease/exonuclease/phosphatase family protein [Alteraurantiacibacter aquimixticola]|nr:endonuclease/exonuclease/phosphatase family protein [Alteraurantiacibacter aquimixticola]